MMALVIRMQQRWGKQVSGLRVENTNNARLIHSHILHHLMERIIIFITRTMRTGQMIPLIVVRIIGLV